MPTERIDIVVSERGAKTVARSIGEIGPAAEKAGTSVQFLQEALALLGAGKVLSELRQSVDAFTLLENRIRVVTGSTAELTAVTDELLAVSQRTRASLDTTATLYSRLALSTADLGITQGQTLDVTELLNKAVAASGATAAEAQGALVQLSQGIGSNFKAAGQELASLAEQLPFVLRIIAKDLGTSVAGVRELAKEGKLTGIRVVEAFENQRAAIEEMFNQTLPTLEQAFLEVRNSVVVFLGRFNEATGISRLVSRVFHALAEDAEFLGRSVIAGVLTVAIVGATVAFRLLTAAIASNPFGALFVGLTAATSALVAFGGLLPVTKDGLVDLGDFVSALGSTFGVFFTDLVRDADTAFSAVNEGATKVEATFDTSFSNALLTAARFADDFVGVFRGLAFAVRNVLTELAEFFVGIASAISLSAQNLGTSVNQALHGNFDAAQQFASQAASTLENGLSLAVEKADFGKAIAEGFQEGLDISLFEDAVGAVLETAAVNAKKDAAAAAEAAAAAAALATTPVGGGLGLAEEPVAQLGGLDAVLRDLEDQANLLRLGNREREVQNDLLRIEQTLRGQNIELTAEEKANLEVKLQEIQLLRDQADALDAINGPLEAFKAGTAAVNALLDQEAISAKDAKIALQNLRLSFLQTQTDFASGFEAGFIQVDQHLNDFATGAAQLVNDTFGGLENALFDFAKSGEASFDQLTNAILDDLIRLASQQLVLALFNLVAPGAGSAAGALGAIFGGAAANGAHTSAGKTYLVGEEGPELFKAPSSGEIVPAPQTAAALAGAPPEVNVRIVNVTDPDEVAAVLSGSRGDEIIMNVVRRNRGKLRRELA